MVKGRLYFVCPRFSFVISKKTGETVKSGISGKPLNPDGTSARGIQSAAKADEILGGPKGTHAHKVIKKEIPGRVDAKKHEQKVTDKIEVRRPGTANNKVHKDSTPSVKTKQEFKDKYGHEHNKNGHG